jgi:hypothetical protein
MCSNVCKKRSGSCKKRSGACNYSLITNH